MNIDDFPKPPIVTAEDLKIFRELGDFRRPLFEWYKYVTCICKFFCSIQPDSEALRSVKPIQYTVLIGLLNRCAKLMQSNLALSQNGSFGETTAIIDRCIFESCVKVGWLCEEDTDNRFDLFIADGLNAEVRLKSKILQNVDRRNGKMQVIEKRILDSIEKVIMSSGLSEDKIISLKKREKKLPAIDKMMGEQNNLSYVVMQKIGSHHVHGTWPSLLFHYLESGGPDLYSPKGLTNTGAEQYVIISLYILYALESFVKFSFSNPGDIQTYIKEILSIKTEILKIHNELIGNDFEILPLI